MAHEVFISYSHKDKQIADSVCFTLESKGIRCWIAPRDILPGMDWSASIIDAIAASRVMVLVLSSSSNTSPQVSREVERAVNKNVIILPFRTENVSLSKSLEYHLSSTHWLDASTPPIEKHLPTLAEKINQILPAANRTAKPLVSEPHLPPEPSSQTWSPIYLGVGLVVGLIFVTGLIWLFVRTNEVPDNTTVVQKQASPAQTSPAQTSPTPTPKKEENQAVTTQNQNNTAQPNTGSQPSVPPIAEKTYDKARKLLIDAGWQPNKNRWTYGENENVQSGNGPTFWKKGYWELVSCVGSAQAECHFEFIDANGRILDVVTIGEEDEAGGKYHATVLSYAFKKK